jgi:hypothetical protein
MNVKHRISAIIRSDDVPYLARCGVAIEEGHRTFVISERSPAWPMVRTWAEANRAGNVVSTEFDQSEIESAGWLALSPEWHHGYPVPRDAFEYLERTYDLTSYCVRCGVGAVQKAPFRMLREPRWGRHNILQLNWIFDEYFATPAISTSTFEPRGVPNRPVLNVRGDPLAKVAQLKIDTLVDIDMSGYPGEVCRDCGVVRYRPISIGGMPPLIKPLEVSAAKSCQYFGVGRASYRVVIIGKDLGADMRRNGVSGVSHTPGQPFIESEQPSSP